MARPIATAREAAGFKTRYAAAKALGVMPHRYNEWEAGTVEPGRKSLLRIAQVFGCTVDALMGRSPTEVA